MQPVAAVRQKITRGTLLAVPTGALSESMIRAIEHEIPLVSVVEMDDLALAASDFAAPVRLILIAAEHAHALPVYGPAIRRSHPNAAIALVATDRRVPLSRYRELAASGRIGGILPVDLNFDVWLAALRLLLSGGEFFPAALFKCDTPSMAAYGFGAVTGDIAQPGLDGLTEREIEVLDLVARGRQNKMIAAELNLSEHTVKVHLHNIISKMQVNNRTEAASIYLEHRPVPSEMSLPSLSMLGLKE